MKCACGCGEETNIIIGIPRLFIHNHHLRGDGNPSNKRDMSGKNNPFYGKRHSELTKSINSEKHMGKIPSYKICGGQHISIETEFKKGNTPHNKGKNTGISNISEEGRKIISETQRGNQHALGIKHTEEWKKNRSERMCGSNHPNWQGGISFLPYCKKFNKQLRESVREQYGYKCILCGMSEEENKRKLSVHHIDYDKEQGCNGKKWELVPLCMSCHIKTNHNRKENENKIRKLLC